MRCHHGLPMAQDTWTITTAGGLLPRNNRLFSSAYKHVVCHVLMATVDHPPVAVSFTFSRRRLSRSPLGAGPCTRRTTPASGKS